MTEYNRLFGSLLLLSAQMPLPVSQAGKLTGASAGSKAIVLEESRFEHISFKRIEPSQYHFERGVLHSSVSSSASFLMQAFDMPIPVSSVRFEWQMQGRLKLKDSQQEKTKKGDDAVLKIGLLVKGKDGFDNPLAPGWVKQVESLLNEPSNSMYYLVADSKHTAKDRWDNPYNKKVTMVSMNNIKNGDWNYSHYQFDTPVEVVAIWIMADGDNTKSVFMSKLRNLVLN